jgi:hypothetical protein
LGYRVWVECQLYGMVTQGAVGFGELGFGVVGLDPFYPVGVVDLGPEVVGVGLCSVDAAVGFGDDDGQHLALGAGEG